MTFDTKIIALSIVLAGALIAGAVILTNTGGLLIPAQQQAQALLPEDNEPVAEVGLGTLPFLGDKDAPITIIEFSDFQCPFCARFFQDAEQKIIENYVKTGKARLAYRDFPLSFHENAQKAAEAARCANEQGKFWEYHNAIFQNQSDLSSAALKRYATAMGLNAAQFNNCLDSGKYAEAVQKDYRDGTTLGVSGTPTFFINGKRIVGAQPYEAFRNAIEEALKNSN